MTSDPPRPSDEPSKADAPAEPANDAPAPKRRRARSAATPANPPAAETKTDAPAAEPSAPRAARRPELDPATVRLLAVRRRLDRRRPIFGRQAANRYWRIGRDGAWRRPRGLQSKQRRHYGYRPRIVRIGYRSPAAVRGLTPTGFRPVLIRLEREIDRLDPLREAAVIARTVGTRRRLLLETAARRRGVHVLNPIAREEREE